MKSNHASQASATRAVIKLLCAPHEFRRSENLSRAAHVPACMRRPTFLCSDQAPVAQHHHIDLSLAARSLHLHCLPPPHKCLAHPADAVQCSRRHALHPLLRPPRRPVVLHAGSERGGEGCVSWVARVTGAISVLHIGTRCHDCRDASCFGTNTSSQQDGPRRYVGQPRAVAGVFDA